MVTHAAGGNSSGEATTPPGSIFREATRQLTRKIRFMCANKTSTFFRSLRD